MDQPGIRLLRMFFRTLCEAVRPHAGPHELGSLAIFGSQTSHRMPLYAKTGSLMQMTFCRALLRKGSQLMHLLHQSVSLNANVQNAVDPHHSLEPHLISACWACLQSDSGPGGTFIETLRARRGSPSSLLWPLSYLLIFSMRLIIAIHSCRLHCGRHVPFRCQDECQRLVAEPSRALRMPSNVTCRRAIHGELM
jgi:hypothetical protein